MIRGLATEVQTQRLDEPFDLGRTRPDGEDESDFRQEDVEFSLPQFLCSGVGRKSM